jgi:hypothetical protein
MFFTPKSVSLIEKMILQKGAYYNMKKQFVQQSAITRKIKNLNRKSGIDTITFGKSSISIKSGEGGVIQFP